jgi:hypothetical protein
MHAGSPSPTSHPQNTPDTSHTLGHITNPHVCRSPVTAKTIGLTRGLRPCSLSPTAWAEVRGGQGWFLPLPASGNTEAQKHGLTSPNLCLGLTSLNLYFLKRTP